MGVKNSPTRFGRVTLSVEPEGRGRWRVSYVRAGGMAPQTLEMPSNLGSLRLTDVKGAAIKRSGTRALADPAARNWSATYES